ncbi:MAG TPA: hypothetical protein VKF41_07685 [Bryobacteraceae bacterium]|nr:hypothetical protein [Bryobacteraceae bacterium]
MNLEEELRKALRREEPPAGFAERVLARAAAQAEEPARRWWRFPRMRLATLAACAVLLVAAGAGYRQWQGETAKQKTLLALGIAGGELHATQIRVRHILAARTGAPMEDQ